MFAKLENSGACTIPDKKTPKHSVFNEEGSYKRIPNLTSRADAAQSSTPSALVEKLVELFCYPLY